MTNNALTKAEIATYIANKCIIKERLAVKIVDSILNLISDNIINNNDITITNFGKFTVKDKKIRYGRNPKTKVAAVIAPRKVLKYKTNKILLDKINSFE